MGEGPKFLAEKPETLEMREGGEVWGWAGMGGDWWDARYEHSMRPLSPVLHEACTAV